MHDVYSPNNKGKWMDKKTQQYWTNTKPELGHLMHNMCNIKHAQYNFVIV